MKKLNVMKTEIPAAVKRDSAGGGNVQSTLKQQKTCSGIVLSPGTNRRYSIMREYAAGEITVFFPKKTSAITR
jgi:hypothetical protein